jgi:hypothetical protein
VQRGGAVRDYRQDMDRLVDQLHAALVGARQRFPGDDYCARVYYCVKCRHLDGAIAPAEDLPDDYACPSCKRPQQAIGPLLDLQGVRVT